MKKLFLILLLTISTAFADGVFNPAVEIQINGLVCPSCAIGVKKIFQEHFYVKQVKMKNKIKKL